MADHRLRSLLEDLTTITPKKKELEHLEVQARRMFNADIKLFQLIDELVEDEEEREDLKKRFVSSVRLGKFRKFEIGIARLRQKRKDDRDRSEDE